MKDESSWVERFYTHYLGRDLAYLFAGGLFICAVQIALYDTINPPSELSLKLLGFVLGSYFLGLTFRAFISAAFPKYFEYKHPKFPSELGLSQYLSERTDDRILNQRERFFYMLAIYLSIGTSSIFSGALMLIGRWFFRSGPTINDCILSVGLILGGIFMLWRAYYWIKKIEDEDTFLINYFTGFNLRKSLFKL
jgi:hypothetical protein